MTRAAGHDRPHVRRLAWAGVTLLVMVGIASGIGRSIYVDDFMTRADPFRAWLFEATGRRDPFSSTRPALLQAVDERFARHRVATLTHVIAGALFLGLAPLQLSSRIRRRNVRFHRWSGRVLVLTAVSSGLAGLYFGWRAPLAGAGEVMAITVFGSLFLVAMANAFIAIRRRDVARHRAWMIRGFAIALGIAVVRLVAGALDLALTPAGAAAESIFVLSLWIGWGLSLGAAELWLTVRPRPSPLR